MSFETLMIWLFRISIPLQLAAAWPVWTRVGRGTYDKVLMTLALLLGAALTLFCAEADRRLGGILDAALFNSISWLLLILFHLLWWLLAPSTVGKSVMFSFLLLGCLLSVLLGSFLFIASHY